MHHGITFVSCNTVLLTSPLQPEMSHNVQKYDKQVYLRVSEAQRCRVHSTLVMPVFDSGDGEVGARPIAVFELVQADKDVPFPAVIAELRKCLTVSGWCGVKWVWKLEFVDRR